MQELRQLGLTLPAPAGQLPATAFVWRQTGGDFIAPADMRTGHLFNTLKMIWNNSAPFEMRLHPIRLYHFCGYYTVDYMTQAVKALVAELAVRDLTGHQANQLLCIRQHLKGITDGNHQPIALT